MDDASVFNLYPSEEAEIEKQLFGIFADDAFDLFEDIIEYDFCGLFLEFCQFGDSCGVQLDGGEGEVNLVLHLHAVLDQKLLHYADDHLLAALFCPLRTQLH